MNKPIIACNVILGAWFVHRRHYLDLERTKTFGVVFVFVLAHEKAISRKENYHGCDAKSTDECGLDGKIDVGVRVNFPSERFFGSDMCLFVLPPSLLITLTTSP